MADVEEHVEGELEIFSSEGEQSISRKRKRVEHDAGGVPLVDKSKKRQRRQQERARKKKLRSIDDETLNEELGINEAYAHMNAGLLADHLGQRTQQSSDELSPVEIEDLRIYGLVSINPILINTTDCAQSKHFGTQVISSVRVPWTTSHNSLSNMSKTRQASRKRKAAPIQ
jgi:hypothetical protein